MTSLKCQNAIKHEIKNKGCGWWGFSVGSRPRRVPDPELESDGWTAWIFPRIQNHVWYNERSDHFQTEKPSNRENVFIRKCPGCSSALELTWPSQYCSRSCMYNDTAIYV